MNVARRTLQPLPALLVLSGVAAIGTVFGVPVGAPGADAKPAGKQPADAADGPPFVTCKGWAVGDGRTGELLWGGSAEVPLKAASTTKIMCAYVVLRLAAADPTVLDETVTYSKLADETGGSTSDVRAGERLAVRECLYGLLLPSGNDAGVALAEHFNARLAPPDPKATAPGTPAATAPAATAPAPNTRTNFVAEMNRAAARLGLADTVYRIPFGDGGGPRDMTTSPRDLLKLAAVAMQDPAFRRYVNTARRETDVERPDGPRRRVVWENTNRLLGVAGYDGVKTGSTTQAGSCLVTSARRGDDHLIAVVLGSTSDDGRYVDTRNLLRWAWQQRAKR